MTEILKNFYELISLFDLIYLIITILSLIKCSRKGFVLSVLAASKWLFAYVITLIIFPRIKPYFKDVIDNGVTTSFPLLVKTVFISDPLFFNKRISSRLLYAAIPPVIINNIFLSFK